MATTPKSMATIHLQLLSKEERVDEQRQSQNLRFIKGIKFG